MCKVSFEFLASLYNYVTLFIKFPVDKIAEPIGFSGRLDVGHLNKRAIQGAFKVFVLSIKRARLPLAEMWKAVDGEGFVGRLRSFGYAEFELSIRLPGTDVEKGGISMSLAFQREV